MKISACVGLITLTIVCYYSCTPIVGLEYSHRLFKANFICRKVHCFSTDKSVTHCWQWPFIYLQCSRACCSYHQWHFSSLRINQGRLSRSFWFFYKPTYQLRTSSGSAYGPRSAKIAVKWAIQVRDTCELVKCLRLSSASFSESFGRLHSWELNEVVHKFGSKVANLC